MGAKEDLLHDLLRLDQSGGVQLLHDQLINAGLKFKGSDNSQTLLYLYRRGGHDIGVSAMRGTLSQSLFSLPKTFWLAHPCALAAARNRASSYYIEPEGPGTSSQYSAAQFEITPESIEVLQAIVQEIVIPEIITAQR